MKKFEEAEIEIIDLQNEIISSSPTFCDGVEHQDTPPYEECLELSFA